MKLDGIRVLDLSRFLPGPWISMTMADHGAEVIKVEGASGEPTRHIGPPIKGHTAYFRNTQRGKRSIVLDLKSDEGREVFLQLAESSDVVIDSFRPGVVDRLGIGYDAVRARVPGIVYCSLSAFGQDGAYRLRPSHDLGAEGLAGVLSLTREKGGKPAMPTLPVADIACASNALIAILMALLRREQTGAGDFIDAGMVDALMAWTPHIISPVLAENRPSDPSTERLYGGAAFYDRYRTADGEYIVLAGSELNFVKNLLDALGRADLIELCREAPGEPQSPVHDFLAETFLTKTRDEWDAWLADKDVCYAPVLNMQEAWRQPYLREREMVLEGDDGIEHLGTAVKFRQEPGNPVSAVPELGADTEALLTELGYDEDARRRMRESGACG